jgi:response regulator NasT
MTGIRILLVDDDRLILATLARALSNSDYLVSTADSGNGAIDRAAGGHYDLAIVDMRMPGMSGCETARRLRDEYGIPSLFLSAYSDRELVEQAVAEGGLGYLVKPVDAAQLMPAIEAAVARARDLAALGEERRQLERALAGGRATSMAVGIMMERRKLGEQAAFDELRATARKNQRKLEDQSREVVELLERLNGF